MKITKKCAICGYEFTYNDEVVTSIFVRPASDGAKYYFDLWHYNVECCPECGYASRDVSTTLYKKIVEDKAFKEIDNNPMIRELNKARPNKVGFYLKASCYYESIGDTMNHIISLLQASDLVYAELMYWDEYVLDDSNSISALIGKSQFNELKKFADVFFNKAVELLEDYVKNNSDDVDANILLAGTLSDGDKIQVMKSVKILNMLKSVQLTKDQKQALSFLLEGL